MFYFDIGFAKIDLVTLPSRDKVFLTLYKKPDMTIVREIRALSLRQGINELQFSWLNTQIDPTSIDMIPSAGAEGVHIENISFPARINQMAIWKINSTKDVSIPMQLSYLTSGLDWRAYYAAILSPDETKMQLNGYVRVNNHSGESFDNAKICLVMGTINMVESIAKLAQNIAPYGMPEHSKSHKPQRRMKKSRATVSAMPMMDTMALESSVGGAIPNAIQTASASDYTIFEIDREENLENGWGKQLVFLENHAIPITNVYRFNPQKYGKQVVRVILFKNKDQTQKTQKMKYSSLPLPGGLIRIYRDIYKKQHFSYEGQARLDDVPIGKDVEIELGHQNQVNVEKKQMKFRSDHYKFNEDGNITGWDEFIQDRIELNNTRSVSVFVEIICSFNATDWTLVQKDNWVSFERIDQHSVKFRVELEKNTRKGFSYDLTIHRKGPEIFMGSRSRF